MNVGLREDFEAELQMQFIEAADAGKTSLVVSAGRLHRAVGAQAGSHHHIEEACNVMRLQVQDGDEILDDPLNPAPRLTIRYKIPRRLAG